MREESRKQIDNNVLIHEAVFWPNTVCGLTLLKKKTPKLGPVKDDFK